MTDQEVKLANQLMWAVKGHLIPAEYSESDIERVLDSYFKRMWGNHEYCYRLEGFDEAWANVVKM